MTVTLIDRFIVYQRIVGSEVLISYQVRLFDDDCLIGQTEIHCLLAKVA